MTTANHEKATHLHNELAKEWSKGVQANLPSLNTLLLSLKIELSELGLLFPNVEDKTTLNTASLTTARDILEIGAFVSIRSKDVPSFERYLNLLNTYYDDLSASIPQSVNEAPLLALSLLRLLSQNRIAEFHTLLETLSKAIVSSHDVNWVINLERSLMEGSYSRVWQLCSNPQSLPRPEFEFFVSTLVGMVRNEIASCQERSYATLPLSNARTLLFFSEEKEVKEFAIARGWHLEGSIIHFASSPLLASKGIRSTLSVGLEDKELDKEKVVKAALGYARELESIV